MITKNQPTHVPYMLIIYTRYAGPTNTQGSRIIATSTYFGKNGRVIRNRDPALSGEENHLTTAWKFIAKHATGTTDEYQLVGVSDNPTGSGNAWIFERVGV